MLTAISNPPEPESDRRLLAIQEANISKNVLKVVDQKYWNQLSFQGKQHEFYDTCMAISQIVNNKLYRCISPSLEGYFKKKWSVSRAQVYRLYESSSILKLLQGPVYPFKERICRQLKNCVGVDQDLLRDLWQQVLDSTDSDENQLSLINIEDFYQKVIGGKPKVRSGSKKAASALVYSSTAVVSIDGLDTDYSEEGISLRKRERAEGEALSGTDSAVCASEDSFNSRNGYNLRQQKAIKLENEENYPSQNTDRIVSKKRALGPAIETFDMSQPNTPLRGLEKDLYDCQEAMNNLISMGYVVESCIDGQWYQPDHWKLESVLARELLELSRSQSAKRIERILSSGLADY